MGEYTGSLVTLDSNKIVVNVKGNFSPLIVVHLWRMICIVCTNKAHSDSDMTTYQAEQPTPTTCGQSFLPQLMHPTILSICGVIHCLTA